MEFRQLKYFVALAKYRNFTRAAEASHIAQSTLSQQIAELENSLGVQLFQRSSRSVSLLPAGEALLAEAQPLLIQYEKCLSAVEPFRTGCSGHLTVATLSVVEPLFLPQFIAYFEQKYPSITLDFVTGTFVEMMNMLENRTIDVCLNLIHPNRRYPHLQWVKVNSDRLSLITANTPEYADITSIEDPKIPALLERPCHLYNGWFNYSEPLQYLASRTTRLPLQYCSNAPTILMKVLARSGTTLVPEQWLLSYGQRHLYHAIPLPDHYSELDFSLVRNKRNPNPCAVLFLEEAESFLKTIDLSTTLPQQQY